MEGLLAYINMVTISHKMVGLERMSDYGDAGITEVSLYTCP